MPPHPPRLLVLPLLLGALSAQNDVGFTRGWAEVHPTRIGANTIAADCLNHVDSRDYRDWMLDPADPTGTSYRFTALRFVLQDQLGSTQETFHVVAYHEDPQNPDFPDPTSPWLQTGAITTPASPSPAPAAWIITITLPNVPPAAKGDKWLGVRLLPPAAGSWPADGASLWATMDRAVNSTSPIASDQAGPRIDGMPNGQPSCYLPIVQGQPTGPAVYGSGVAGSRRQLLLEVLADVAGGVCVTQTNQTSYPSSRAGAPGTPLGGTTNFFSGLHPDVYDGNLSTLPRADDPGFLVTEATLPNAPVFVIVALGPRPGGSAPLRALFPGALGPNTRGNLCIDPAGATFLGLADATGLHQRQFPLNPAARAIIQGLSAPGAPFDLWYQGFVLDVNTLSVRATGCGIQHL